MIIYAPSEDSYFFFEFLDKYLQANKIKKFLDIGSGSGILAKKALKFLKNENVIAADINPLAIAELKKQGITAIKSDLFEKIKGKYDLITFNAPYLPLDKREPKESRTSTTGGKAGDEISLRFLKQAKKYLNQGGKVLLLISSLTPQKRIKGYNPREVARKKVFSEDLIIFEFKESQM